MTSRPRRGSGRKPPLPHSLVALSPQTPDNSLSTQQKDELTFAVLSDKGNAVAKQFGIAYKLPAELPAAFKGKLDLEKFNGDTSEELPLAATYVSHKAARFATPS